MNRKIYDWMDEQPWFEIDNYYDIILDKASILNILDIYGIEYTKAQSGNFTHKMHCPLPKHKERTPSFYVSEDKNDFCCFGCNSNGSIIDLVMELENVPFYSALEKITSYIKFNPSDGYTIPTKTKQNPKETTGYYIFRAGVELRKFIETKGISEKARWFKLAQKIHDKMDFYLDLDDSEWEKAKEYYLKLKNFIAKN